MVDNYGGFTLVPEMAIIQMTQGVVFLLMSLNL